MERCKSLKMEWPIRRIFRFFILFWASNLFAANVYKFSQFKNFNSTYYNSETGQPALSFSFKEISKESPKLGFLKFSIPFFIVENLSVRIEMEHVKSDSLFADIKEYHQKEAIRFLRARNVKVKINSKISEFSSLSLIFPKGNEPYSLTNQNEQTVLKIFESFHSIESEVLSKP